ncbi:MAG: PqqD family protein [Bacteroidota bacterium]
MKIKKDIAISETGFIFNPSTGESFSVNYMGAEIISRMKEGLSFEEIKKEILEKFQTDEDTFEKDYNDYMNLLRGYNLLESE